MTNKEASFLLGAYRPNGLDAANPEFAEALDQAARDPELKHWFEDQRDFDSKMAAGVRSVPVPPDLRARIMAGAKVSRPARWYAPRRLLAMAALAMAFAAAGLWYGMRQRGPGWEDQSLVALSSLLSGQDKFDAQSPSVADLQRWLSGAGSPNTAALPARLTAYASLGCKTISWRGHPISIICFHGPGNELVHLAMVDKASLPNPPPEGHPEYEARDGWRMACWSQGSLAMMLVTRGPESDLRTILAAILLF